MAPFDPYHIWLGIPPQEQPPNHYRLLAIPELESNPDVIDAAAEQRTLFLRTFRTGDQTECAEQLLNEVSAARVCLLNPLSKEIYDEQLAPMEIGDSLPLLPTPIEEEETRSPWKRRGVLIVLSLCLSLFLANQLYNSFRKKPPADPEIVKGEKIPRLPKKPPVGEPIPKNPPPPLVLEEVPDQVVNEGETLQLDISTKDKKANNQTFIYALENQPPRGCTLDGDSGQLTWIPEEDQGPAEYEITVSVRTVDQPKPDDTVTFNISVKEVNRPPIIDSIAAPFVIRDSELRIQLSASDPDLPVNTLVWTLDERSPKGARIDGRTGKLTWTPGITEDTGSHRIVVQVRDNGIPAQTASYEIPVTVTVLASSLQRTLMGHNSGISSIAWSPDGTKIASGDDGTSVRIWNGETGALIRELSEHNDAISCVGWNADGSLLASSSYDHDVKIWDVATGKIQYRMKEQEEKHTDTVHSVAFSPDGAILATASSDKTIRLWDTKSRNHIRTLMGHTHRVRTLSWSPDGTRLASGSYDNSVKIWDVRQGENIATLSGHDNDIHSVAFSPDGTMLASAGKDGSIRIWDASTHKLRQSLLGHTSSIGNISWSPDSQQLASASYNDDVKIWSVATGKNLHVISGYRGYVMCVSFAPSGTRLATGGEDKQLRIWKLSPEAGKLPSPPRTIAPFNLQQAKIHQHNWAVHLGQNIEFIEPKTKMKFVLVPPGEASLGAPEISRDIRREKPQHKVWISKPFYLGVFEVTQEQYQRLTITNPSKWPGPDKGECPVEKTTWYDARVFCQKLSSASGKVFRLPTDAEWEYACRAGSITSYSFGNDWFELEKHAWFGNNSGDESIDAFLIMKKRPDEYDSYLDENFCRSHPVGTRKPNSWGLFDMHGNVWEWCSDWFANERDGGEDFFRQPPFKDPAGPLKGSKHVIRGGSLFNDRTWLRSSMRDGITPIETNSHHVGFRVLLEIPTQEIK